MNVLGGALIGPGLLLLAWVAVAVGRHPARTSSRGRPALVLAGPYRRCRQPVSLALLLLALGVGCAVDDIGALLASLFAAFVLVVHAYYRDAQQTRWHGAAYSRYRKRVPLLLPLGPRR